MAPWEPLRKPEFLTLARQHVATEQLLAEQERGLAIAQLILDEHRIIGQVTLSNVVRGAFQSCGPGYWVRSADNGRGHATAAVAAIVRLAFSGLGLHRIEAGTLAHNLASQRVLERNGFERFGFAPRYLEIAGRWQDHVLFQKIAPGG